MVFSRNFLSSDNWRIDPNTGKQYLIPHKGSFAHDVYRDLCKRHGAKLPEPHNEEENDFLDSLNTEMFVLGINDKEVVGQWRFDSDNSPVTWFNWAQKDGIPNRWPNANCAHMLRNVGDNNHWSGYSKKSWSNYICESVPFYDTKRKQLVCERDLC